MTEIQIGDLITILHIEDSLFNNEGLPIRGLDAALDDAFWIGESIGIAGDTKIFCYRDLFLLSGGELYDTLEEALEEAWRISGLRH